MVTAASIISLVPTALSAIFTCVIASSATSKPILLKIELTGLPVISSVFVGDDNVPVPENCATSTSNDPSGACISPIPAILASILVRSTESSCRLAFTIEPVCMSKNPFILESTILKPVISPTSILTLSSFSVITIVLSFSSGLNIGSDVKVDTPKSDKGTETESPLLSVNTKSSPAILKSTLNVFNSVHKFTQILLL